MTLAAVGTSRYSVQRYLPSSWNEVEHENGATMAGDDYDVDDEDVPKRPEDGMSRKKIYKKEREKKK